MSTPTSGRMAWAQALEGPLAGATCLWQDLDGLHVEPAPPSPPQTSLLWGWREDSHLVRLRLDGGTAFVAVHTIGDSETPTSLLPWSPADQRVAAHSGRGPSADAGGLGTAYEQVVIDGIADGAGPITFVQPARRTRPGQVGR